MSRRRNGRRRRERRNRVAEPRQPQRRAPVESERTWRVRGGWSFMVRTLPELLTGPEGRVGRAVEVVVDSDQGLDED